MRDAERWEANTWIRAYVAAVQRVAAESGQSAESGTPEAVWLHWADGIARALDRTSDAGRRLR